MHRPSEKFIVHQSQTLGSADWSDVSAEQCALDRAAGWPVRRLAVMPDFEIAAKRWFNGENTFHSVTIYDVRNDTYEAIGKMSFVYGYGDHWQVTAFEMVKKMPELFGELPDRAAVHPGQYLRDELNIASTVADVKRKRDL